MMTFPLPTSPAMPLAASPASPVSVPMADGSLRCLHAWPVQAPRARILVAHGLGEHGGRYAAFAGRLNAWGFAVYAHDHFGHGRSPGKRGVLPSADALIDDMAVVVDWLRGTACDPTPLVLLGHSMGGLLAARFVVMRKRPVDALVLSSPALATHMGSSQRLLAKVLARVAPNVVVGNGLDVARISHDPAQVAAYRADALVHDRISARLAHAIATGGEAVLAAAATWSVPTLLLHAGDDALVDADGSRAFARRAPAGIVQAREFPGLYHELFNEADPAPVYDALAAWLHARFPA